MSGLNTAIRARLTLHDSGEATVPDMRCAYDCETTQAALLAALDLHKPVVGVEESSGGLLLCAECGPGEDEHYKPLWPCPTVGAIAKALGIEADG